MNSVSNRARVINIKKMTFFISMSACTRVNLVCYVTTIGSLPASTYALCPPLHCCYSNYYIYIYIYISIGKFVNGMKQTSITI